MNPQAFGWQHLTYLAVCVVLTVIGLICVKKFAKTEKSQMIITKVVAGILLISIVVNRISLVYKYSDVHWELIIPDSFCGMSSLVLSLAVLLGKKDNNVLHFVWFIALMGGVITLIYPDFIGQSTTIFYLPTFSGLIHHTISVVLVILILLTNQLHITYKKWYCTLFGFTSYFTVGAFLISVFKMEDAFNIMTPIVSGTPLTAWVMAPIYVFVYAILLLAVELIRRKKNKKIENATK